MGSWLCTYEGGLNTTRDNNVGACAGLGKTKGCLVCDPGCTTSPACWECPGSTRDVHSHTHTFNSLNTYFSSRQALAEKHNPLRRYHHSVQLQEPRLDLKLCTSYATQYFYRRRRERLSLDALGHCKSGSDGNRF